MGSSRPMITSRREGNVHKQTKLKISSHSIIDQSVRFFACVRAVRGQCYRSAGSAATSLATESTGTVLTPRQMSEIAGHAVLRSGVQTAIAWQWNWVAVGCGQGGSRVQELSHRSQADVAV